MDMQELIEIINNLKREEIDDILYALIRRKRQLYPDWEIIYYAGRKGEHVEMDLLRRLMGGKQHQQ